MANLATDDLPNAATLTGAERIHVVQGSNSRKTTLTLVKDYITAQLASAFAAKADASAVSTALAAKADSSAMTTALASKANAADLTALSQIVRERLTGDRIYFIRLDGNDANTGLADTAGSALRTIEQAYNLAKRLDCNGFRVKAKINVNGTFVTALVADQALINTPYPFEIHGNGTAQYIRGVGSDAILAVNGGYVYVHDAVLQTTTKGNCLNALFGGRIEWAAVDFSICVDSHVNADQGGFAVALGNYRIIGSATSHWHAPTTAKILVYGRTITLVGTPNFSGYFAGTAACGVIQVPSNTFVGTATGYRFLVHKNAFIESGTGNGVTDPNNPSNPNYLPGSLTGVEYTGGKYC